MVLDLELVAASSVRFPSLDELGSQLLLIDDHVSGEQYQSSTQGHNLVSSSLLKATLTRAIEGVLFSLKVATKSLFPPTMDP